MTIHAAIGRRGGTSPRVLIDGELWTLQHQYRKCGKASCTKCHRPGSKGHGPYYYAYKNRKGIDGKKSHYFGVKRPENVIEPK